jgi:multidrug efflux system membrane fusion protein
MSDTVAPPRKRSRLTVVICAVILLALAALVLYHVLHRKAPPRGEAPQVVDVSPATPGTMPETLSELGTVTPLATVTVLPQLSGYLTDVAFHEGEDVKKGQFLAQIDPRQYLIDKQQSEAALSKDQALLAEARADLARYEQLNQHKSIAEQTYIDQRFLVQQDVAAVKSDQAAIAQYDLDLTYCHIVAPVSGRVGLRLVDTGNYVTASSDTGIVVITTMKPTTVEFTVPQNALDGILQRLHTGATLPVTAYSSDNTRLIATGKLYAVSNQMTTSTGTVTLRASFDNDDEALFPNEFVNVKLLVDTLQNAVLVPTAAVQNGAPGDYVYLVNANNTVSVHKVTLGPSDGKNTVITTGLQANQMVVTDGTDRLSDGAKIKAATHAAGSAAPASGTDAASSSLATSSTPASAAHATRHAHASQPAASSAHAAS